MEKQDKFSVVCRNYEGNKGFIHKSMSVSAFEKNVNPFLGSDCHTHWVTFTETMLEEKLCVAEIVANYDKLEHCFIILGDDERVDLGVCIGELWLPEGRWAMSYVVKNHIKR